MQNWIENYIEGENGIYERYSSSRVTDITQAFNNGILHLYELILYLFPILDNDRFDDTRTRSS